MKTILPWLVAVLAVGSTLFCYNSNLSKSADLAKLQAEVQELPVLRAEIAELKNSQVSPTELARLRSDNQDLLRLRNETRQLRDEKLQLQKQVQTAQTALTGAQTESQRVQAQVQALAQAQAQALARPQGQPPEELVNRCINNLRQIDAAKQQWALEQNKTADAIPTAQDLSPYLKDGVMSTCPGGGKYSLKSLSEVPACSIAGHALPPPAQ